jgi:alpha-1,2-mannosyltransferase
VVSARRVALFLVGNFLLVHALLFVLRTRYEDTGLLPIAWFFEGRQGRDSWDPMAQAYLHATTPHRIERPFYWRTAFSPQVLRKGFQYPPTALLIVSGLDAAVGERWPDVLRWITWVMVPLTAVFVWLVWEALPPPRRATARGERVLVALAAVFATLTFYPVMRAYANGQMQTWLNALFAAAVWAWATGRREAAGALLALSCAVKPQLGVFVLWGLIRRQWSFLAAFGLVAAVLVGLSIAMYGWGPHVEYLGMLRFLGERGEAFFPNQSVNGLLNRWLFNGDVLFWKQPWVEHFPPYDARIFVPTVISSLALLAVGLVPPRRPGARAGLIDFCLMGLAATMASPIAWEHHYGVALPVFAVAWRCAAAGARTRLALAVSYVLVSNCFWVTKALAASRWNVLESYLFFGAIVLLVVLVRGRACVAQPSTGAGAGPGG